MKSVKVRNNLNNKTNKPKKASSEKLIHEATNMTENKKDE